MRSFRHCGALPSIREEKGERGETDRQTDRQRQADRQIGRVTER